MEPEIKLKKAKYNTYALPKGGLRVWLNSEPKKESAVSPRVHSVCATKQRQAAQGRTTILGAKTRQKVLSRTPLER